MECMSTFLEETYQTNMAKTCLLFDDIAIEKTVKLIQLGTIAISGAYRLQ